jgi:hypothetical protein
MAETGRLFNDERQQARKSHIAFHTATGQFGLSPCSIAAVAAAVATVNSFHF